MVVCTRPECQTTAGCRCGTQMIGRLDHGKDLLMAAVEKFLAGRMTKFTDSRFVDDDLVALAKALSAYGQQTPRSGSTATEKRKGEGEKLTANNCACHFRIKTVSQL